jgi:hypothetical protein
MFGYDGFVRFAGTIVLLIVAWAGGLEQQPPLPPSDAFGHRIQAAVRLDGELQRQFTYVETRREVKVSMLGKVVAGPVRTFEVYPSADYSEPYKRLVAVDGQPLSPQELAGLEAEHRRDVESEALERQHETPDQRARRLERTQSKRRNALAILDDAFAVYRIGVIGRETIDDESFIRVSMTPQASARPKTREGDWMKYFEGTALFREADAQFAQLDMHATDDISIGWGIVGRLHEGTRLTIERRRVGNTWLPARQTIQASGRTLLFRSFKVDLVTEFSGYKPK